ncbi:hypothetical protein O6H91_19G018400 [Diphasiastrum complanatum]|uniref:Uncharacterized protein n=1 Tax=Diphasiastrum complanatum TaxID=34168 RepID=A0ACC2AT52_DIPCM|nr:hypothetical protein O6H91_19G018400 [Diphasiastrum complanatum]
MEPNAGNISKAQVVYYLSRNGKMEPPHMIEVPYLSNEGLRLMDVKRRLTVLRGNAAGNMFSWSYKRSYKNKYIWLDLSDEDAIVPGGGGEYVLKGSELFDDCQDKMMKYVSSQESDSRKHPEVLQTKYRGAETWLKQDPPKSSSDQYTPSSLKHEVSEKCNGISQGNLNAVRNGSHKKSFPTDYAQALSKRGIHGFSAPDDFLADNKISSSSDLSDSSTQTIMNDIKVLQIKSTVVPARHGCDAATQTDLDNSRYYESLTKQEKANNEISKPWKIFNNEHQGLQPNQAEASLLSMISGEITSDQNMSSKKKQCKVVNSGHLHDKDSGANVRLKHTTASRVFLQILSCGGVDTKVQENNPTADTKETALENNAPREQPAGRQSLPSSRVRSKPVTPRGPRSPESFDSRMGTPITYSCELELDTGNNHEAFGHTIKSRSSEVEEVVTALPSPCHESKIVSRCSSFSSRRSSRSTDFDIQQDKKIKDIGTAFGTPCKTPGGSPIPSGLYKSAHASRVVSPIRLPSSEGDRESWQCNLGQQLISAHIVDDKFNSTEHLQNPAESKWKDLSPINRDTRLPKVDEREHLKPQQHQDRWSRDARYLKTVLIPQ